MPILNIGHRLLLPGVTLLIIGLVFLGCGESSRNENTNLLIKVGDRSVSVSQFKQRFDMTVVPYPLKALKDQAHVKSIRLRLLNQLIEELVILSRADELCMTVSSEELTAAIKTIKQDYPDDTFEKMLLEESISFRKWKIGLEKRLLMEKVVENDLAHIKQAALDQGTPLYEPEKTDGITPSDGGEINQMPADNQHAKEAEIPTEDENESPVSEEKQAIEHKTIGAENTRDAYTMWISDLRSKYSVFVDEILWERLKQE